MKQKRTFLTLLLVLVVLCLGIAYAAITSVTLTITGNVSALAADGTIDVRFTKAEVADGSEGAVLAEPFTQTDPGDESTKDYTKATINVSQLTTEGDKATVVYTIENFATDIAATLGTPSVVWDNTEWFDVKCTLSGNDLAKHSDATTDTQTATVVVTLLKTPVSTADQTAAADEITISIVASPVDNDVQ